MNMMKDRKNPQGNNIFGLHKHKRKIKRPIEESKNKWFAKECSETERLKFKRDSFSLHKEVKEATELNKSRKTRCILDEQGNPTLKT